MVLPGQSKHFRALLKKRRRDGQRENCFVILAGRALRFASSFYDWIVNLSRCDQRTQIGKLSKIITSPKHLPHYNKRSHDQWREKSNFFLTQLRRGAERSFRRLSLFALSQLGNIVPQRAGEVNNSVLYLAASTSARVVVSQHNSPIGDSLFQIGEPHRTHT